VPAVEIAKVVDVAESTAGHVAALMMDIGTRMDDCAKLEATAQPSRSGPLVMFEISEELASSELKMVNLKVGPIGWPYLDQRVQHRVLGGWRGSPDPSSEDNADCWLLPRHVIICSFGIFNPMGPTVNSLEAAFVKPFDGDPYWDLYWLLRHPLSPQLTHLGSASLDEGLDALITASLAETDPNSSVFGSGPDWLDIFSHDEAVLDGARRFAAGKPDTDWRLEAMALIVHSSDPWQRITSGVSGEEFDWPAEVEPIDGWLHAVTKPDVIAGHQLFLRSAWEGATAYMDSRWEDSEAAQAATDVMSKIAHARALADYEFRDREDPFVKHPRS
jgi:hypothetical protein